MLRPASFLLLAVALAAAPSAHAQQPTKPPAVGVVKVGRTQVTPSSEFVGRIQATDRVNLVPRVTAFLDKQFFTEGSEVKAGDVLYRLEQAPFRADVQAKQAAIAQVEAQLQNANLTLSRAKALLSTPAGQQSTVDAALAAQQSLEAQLLAAKAQLEQSQINLAYTEIHAPIDGKIGRTAVTVGNVVSPGSGILTSIVSQDPMYVVFPVALRSVLEMQQHYQGSGGLMTADVRVRLPDGRLYDQPGRLDFIDNSVANTTDTVTLRAVIANPRRPVSQGNDIARELVDGELVTVVVREAQPVAALTVPRAAILSDQQGDYVYTVDGDNKAQQQRIKLGQSTPTVAVVADGLNEGDTVIVDGIQRVRPGQAVAPAPAASQAAAPGGAPPSEATSPAKRS